MPTQGEEMEPILAAALKRPLAVDLKVIRNYMNVTKKAEPI